MDRWQSLVICPQKLSSFIQCSISHSPGSMIALVSLSSFGELVVDVAVGLRASWTYRRNSAGGRGGGGRTGALPERSPEHYDCASEAGQTTGAPSDN